jgi:GTPase SAR1 family protein
MFTFGIRPHGTTSSSAPQKRTIVVFGEPGVGKTCFTDQLLHGKSFVAYDPFDDLSHSREFVVDGQLSIVTIMDLSTAFLKPQGAIEHTEWAEKILAEADGVVLIYDISDLETFEYITGQAHGYLWECRRLKDGDEDEEVRTNFGSVLVGNKLDLVATGKQKREVSQDTAKEWAQTQGIKSIEHDCLTRTGPEEALKTLLRNIQKITRLENHETKHTMNKSNEGDEKEGSIKNSLKDIFRSSGA